MRIYSRNLSQRIYQLLNTNKRIKYVFQKIMNDDQLNKQRKQEQLKTYLGAHLMGKKSLQKFSSFPFTNWTQFCTNNISSHHLSHLCFIIASPEFSHKTKKVPSHSCGTFQIYWFSISVLAYGNRYDSASSVPQ